MLEAQEEKKKKIPTPLYSLWTGSNTHYRLKCEDRNSHEINNIYDFMKNHFSFFFYKIYLFLGSL